MANQATKLSMEFISCRKTKNQNFKAKQCSSKVSRTKDDDDEIFEENFFKIIKGKEKDFLKGIEK